MTLTNEMAAQVLAKQPRVQQALHAAHHHARSTVDPALLALCEQRICQLLGAPAHQTDALASAPEVEPALAVAALAFVEQWVIDVAGITDDMVGAVSRHLDEAALMDFVHGVLVIEQRVRLGIAWQQLGLVS